MTGTKPWKIKHWRMKTVDGVKSYSLLYFVWRNMRVRCRNHPRYGGRGIKVCERWNDYDLFADDALANGYRIGLELDRIDNDGDYEPTNCRWVSKTINLRNTHRAKMITWQGETLHFLEWAKRLGIKPDTLRSRVFRRGWPLERAMRK